MLAKKFMFLKSILRDWAKFSFGSVKLKKWALLHDLDNLNLAKESRSLNIEELNQGSDLHLAFDTLLK